MRVPLQIERSIEVPAPAEQVLALFTDLEGTIGRFPKLRKLTRLDDMAYLWEMHTMGSRLANVAVDIAYAARYRVDPRRGELSWVPIPKHGNATIEGSFRLEPRGRASQLSFKVAGQLHDVPVPLVYRLVAPPFIQGKFTRLIDEFLERTRASLTGDGA